MKAPSSKRGPAGNRTSPKRSSGATAEAKGTELLTDPATPGVLALLPHFHGVEHVGNGRWMVLCPVHGDRHRPNLSVDVQRRFGPAATLFMHCKRCGANGDDVLDALGLAEWRQAIYHRNNDAVLQRRLTHAAPLPTNEELDRWSEALWADAARLRYLAEERGLSERVIRRYRLGWNEEQSRYMLPVAGDDGKLANVRRYKPDAHPDEGKMIGLRGRGGQLYPAPPTASDAAPVLVTEGEWDALVARSHGLTAVCGTLGAATWRPAWSGALAGLSVAFIYDCDDAGREGAAAAAGAVLPIARRVRVVDLGLGAGEDLTDWFVTYGRSADDLLRLIASTSSLEREGGGGRG
jgi:DNA primase